MVEAYIDEMTWERVVGWTNRHGTLRDTIFDPIA